MKKHLFVLFIIACLLNTTDVLSLHRETINFVRLDINDGLSNNEINCMLRDRTGFMWFGTASGLNRFDGYQFKTFRNSTEEALISRSDIKEMYESADSCLWLQYYNAEVDVYDLRTGTFLSGEEKLRQYGITGQIERVFTDTDYDLIFQNEKNELIRYSYKDHAVTQFNAYSYGTDKNDKLVYFFSTKDKYYLIYNSGQLAVLNREMNRVLFIDSYLCNQPGTRYRIFVDREEDIWIYPDPAEKRGVYYFRQSDKQWSLLNTITGKWRLSSDIVRDVDQDMNGRIWIATDHGGINLIDKKSGDIRYLRNSAFNPQSISQNSIVSIYKDDTGIMWAGTYKNGINYYHESIFKFTTLKYPVLDSDEQAYNDCSCLYEDERGNIWIGTNGGGLLCFNRQTGKYTKYRHDPADKNSISGDIIISISSDKEGNLWLGSFLNGLNKFDGKRFTHYTVESTKGKLTNNSIYTVLSDTKGKVWIGTLGGGLNCYIPATGEWIYYRESSETHPLSSDYVSSIIESDDGRIIVATSFGVTIIDNETGEASLFQGNKKGDQKLNSSIINSLLWDDRQLLWVGTNNGVSIYDRGKDTIYVLDKLTGLPDNMIMSLKDDKQGNVWVGSRNGLSQIAIQKENEIYHFRIHTFDEEEGIQGRDFNINSVFKNSHDQLLFGGTDGVTIVDPDRIRYNMNRPKVVFTDFWVNNKHVYPKEAQEGRILIDQEINFEKQVTLKYSERNIAVEFSALNYLLPGKTGYEYKMIGFDKEWIPVENSNRRVQYTNLSPGKYTLLVNAWNNDGISSEAPAALDFVIIPPFYRTYWAILFYFILVAVLLYLLLSYLAYRQRMVFREKEERAAIRQMHEIDEMKLRFFTNVSHEFRTPLTLILNPLERLMKKSADSEDKMLIRLIYQNANHLLTLVNQLLDFRKIDMQGHVLTLSVGDIIPFIRDIVYSFKDLSERKNIRFSFHSGFNSLNMKFDKDKVYKIVVNLLSNAFKFTPDGGEIRVTLSLRSTLSSMDELLIRVIDTGIGIEPADQEKIFERFFQSNLENENSAQGTGIGLHLCKEFVKLHNGEITVESETGKGSTFTVSLPVITTDVHEILSHDDSSAEESS